MCGLVVATDYRRGQKLIVDKVGRCKSTLSQPALKAPMVSALEPRM